jgi:hypothetical protein
MTRFEFDPPMRRLEALYNKGQSIDDIRRDEYFKALASYSVYTLEKAVDYLRDNYTRGHGNPFFPDVADVLNSIRDVSLGVSYATADDLAGPCQKCQDEGWTTHGGGDEQFGGTPCTCRLGQTIRRALLKGYRPNRYAPPIEDYKADAAGDREPGEDDVPF